MCTFGTQTPYFYSFLLFLLFQLQEFKEKHPKARILQSLRDSLKAIAKHLMDKLPLNKPHLRSLHCLNLKYIKQNWTKVSIKNLTLKICQIISAEEVSWLLLYEQKFLTNLTMPRSSSMLSFILVTLKFFMV